MQKPVLTSNHRLFFFFFSFSFLLRQKQKRNKKTKEKERQKKRTSRKGNDLYASHCPHTHIARCPSSQRDVSGCSHVDSQVLASCYLPCTPPPTHQHGPVYSVASSLSRAPSSLDHRYSRKCMTGVADSLWKWMTRVVYWTRVFCCAVSVCCVVPCCAVLVCTNIPFEATARLVGG